MSTSDTWKIYDLSEAYKKRPPTKFLVSGIISLPSLSIVYGSPGTLKSMLLADLALCVASGQCWLPPLPKTEGNPITVDQAPVLWLDFDNGKRRMDERFEAIGRTRKLTKTTPFYYVTMPSPWLDVSNRTSIDDLERRIKRLKVKLVIIDNLGLIIGKADENTPEMATVMANLRKLAEDNDIAIIVIHHQRKSNGFNHRAGESLRGHSSIESALDLALMVEREPHSETVTVHSTKTRDIDVPPIGALFTFEHKADTNELATAKFFGLSVEDTSSDIAVQTIIMDTVASNRPINKGVLVSMVKDLCKDVGQNRIRSLVELLDSNGKLVSTNGRFGAKLYDLP